jgi:epoxyqueuosine reductase
MYQDANEILDFIGSAVAAEGLTFLGVAPARKDPEAGARLERWLAEGRHGGMFFMEEHAARRDDPATVLAGAASIVLVGLDYYQCDRMPRGDGPPRIAQYARLKDYHRVLWRRGEAALQAIHARLDPRAVGRVVADSAPLLERSLAARAGGGFIGKNTCFIRPKEGSFVLLGELLTSLALPSTEKAGGSAVSDTERSEAGGCGTCKRCQVACPTGALDRDYSIDARRCLSYWTIEHRGTIPEAYWPWLKLYVFGCDICQLVCPYNRAAKTFPIADLVRVEPTPDLFEIATMTPLEFKTRFGGTPLTRAHHGGLVRNALIAMTVTNDPRLDEAIPYAEVFGDDTVLATLKQIDAWRSAAGRPSARDGGRASVLEQSVHGAEPLRLAPERHELAE